MKPAVLVSLYNPLSTRPSEALLPTGQSEGRRIIDLIQEVNSNFTDDHYVLAFERRVLWPGLELPVGRGSTALLMREGQRLLNQLYREHHMVIVFGVKTWACLVNRVLPPWFDVLHRGCSQFYPVPSLSTRNHAYNDDIVKRKQAGALLNHVGLLSIDLQRERRRTRRRA